MGGFTGSAPGLPYQTGTAGVIAPTGFMSPIASGNPYNVINTRPSLPQVPNFGKKKTINNQFINILIELF